MPSLSKIVDKLLGRGAPLQPPRDREADLQTELGFWRDWFLNKGMEWPDDFKRRFDPELQLQPELAKFASAIPRAEVDVLDVGAGPVTRLGKKLAGKTIRLVPTDFLGVEYNRLIDELGVVPLVRTTFADAEKLTDRFAVDSFDIVHAQNTMDHMERPIAAIDQAILVTRPGGTVYLRHEENEGQRTGYISLHQWNFALEDATKHFVITHVGGERIDVSERTAKLGSSTSYREGQRVVFEFTKS